MKKYRVSLALLEPHNFEVIVEANSAKEALIKGHEIYNSPDWEENGAYIDEEPAGKCEADYDEEGLIDEGDFTDPEEITGVYVEEKL